MKNLIKTFTPVKFPRSGTYLTGLTPIKFEIQIRQQRQPPRLVEANEDNSIFKVLLRGKFCFEKSFQLQFFPYK